MTKLDWNFDNDLNCEVAYLRGYRIRAERDDHPSNPFEEWDGNWPIAVRCDGMITVYEKTKGVPLRDPLSRFNDAQLVLFQRHIAKVLSTDADTLIYHLGHKNCRWSEDQGWIPPKWVTDGAALRSWFEEGMGNVEDNELFEVLVALYKLIDIYAHTATSHGYSQGDWAEVLVVATPEAIAKFGTCVPEIEQEVKADPAIRNVHPDRVDDWVWDRVSEKLLEGTHDLYSAWAWGDVFGYVIEKPIFDADGDIEDWEDACDHNSCWGFYGDDHAESGLEEAALECVPEEPVGSPDNMLEDA